MASDVRFDMRKRDIFNRENAKQFLRRMIGMRMPDCANVKHEVAKALSAAALRLAATKADVREALPLLVM